MVYGLPIALRTGRGTRPDSLSTLVDYGKTAPKLQQIRAPRATLASRR
jgi:hypothetical protein